MRSIEIDGRHWSYKVGKTYVEIHSPEGDKHMERANVIIGISYFKFETARRVGLLLSAVKPRDVRSYIERHVIGDEPVVALPDA